MTAYPTDGSTLTVQLRNALLDLARHEDECAADEAAHQPYWAPCPSSVHGHRAAAVVLRDRADQLLATMRPAVAAGGEAA
jgi:hypothetical protein